MKYIFKKRIYSLAAAVFDTFGYFFSWFFRRRPNPLKKDLKNILIIRMDHLGDVLMAIPVPKIIKENYSNCRVIFLTSSWAAPLLENNPFVDEVLIFDAPWFSKKRYKKSKQGHSFFSLVRILRKKKIDWAIGLRGDLRENTLMALAGIKERVGYGVTGGGFLLTKEVLYRKLAHESERTVELLKAVGIKSVLLEPQIYFSESEEAALESKAREWGMAQGEKYIGFQMDAGTEAKEWPVENIKIFLQAVTSQFPEYKLVLVGTNKATLRHFDAFGPRFINLVGATSLRDLCVLMRKLDVFIGLDSGPAHIAAASGVPTVFLYSGTNRFEQWKPLFEIATVLRHSVPCSPCHLEVCNVKGHPCMSEIKPEDVIKVLEGVLIK